MKIDSGNHLKEIRSLQINEQLQWKASQNFSVELHYTYIHGRSIVENSHWRWEHRFELEANTSFKLFGRCLLDTRNRFEICREQNAPMTLYRFRQRTMLVIPIQGKGILKSFSVFNELFYHISSNHFSQDRVCPCQLTFAVTEKIEMDLFFIVRFFRSDRQWLKSAVVGTQFSF